MHGISAHSALAIKRQRRRQEPRRGKARRASTQPPADHYDGDNKVMGTVTMFHVGAVFLLLSAFLMLGALMTSESKQETAELVGTGIICLLIGIFLVILNRFYGQKEEDDLANYVESRLGRSRSGQRLYHEQESMPENLGAGAGPSASTSADSIAREMSAKKGNKRGKKSKRGPAGPGIGGIEDTTVNGGGEPRVKIDMVNEHNHQYRNHLHTNDVSTANVTLDRITEEVGSDHYHNQPISYVNANYDDGPNSRVASNNLYRVYDRDSYSRGGPGGV